MEKPQPLNRRLLLAGMVALPGLAHGRPRAFDLEGRFVQGGYATGKAAPRREIIVDGLSRGLTSEDGHFVIGFDRDAGRFCTLEIKGEKPEVLEITPITYNVQRVNGLPPATVAPSDPVLLQRIARERALKDQAFASREDVDWFKGDWRKPLNEYRISGRFGNQRVLNGQPSSPHYGIDLAAPTGTPVRAPQKARVVLAEPNLHFEGGLILLDHGQGLISMYLHLSAIEVEKGDIVGKGRLIGRVGATGRATGPHLCWRLKWRDRALDPSLWSGI